MENKNNPTVSRQQPPVRFTLRELFVLTGLVCAFGASWSWARTENDPLAATVLPLIALLSAIAYLIHLLARWPLINIAWAMSPLLAGLCLLPTLIDSRMPSRRLACSNNLRNIALALEQYHQMHDSFPPAYIADENGKPMHSWRVLLLPYLERRDLYDHYDFSEPWDGPNNSKLHGEIIRIYSCPSHPTTQPRTDTSYVAVVGPQTMWPATKATKLDDLTDGATNTLMVVEIANSGIHWMEPRDLDFSQLPMQINPPKGKGISSDHPNVALGAFADGHTQAMSSNTPPKIIRALLTAQGGEAIGDD